MRLIYVHSLPDRDALIDLGLDLINEDDEASLWAFVYLDGVDLSAVRDYCISTTMMF